MKKILIIVLFVGAFLIALPVNAQEAYTLEAFKADALAVYSSIGEDIVRFANLLSELDIVEFTQRSRDVAGWDACQLEYQKLDAGQYGSYWGDGFDRDYNEDAEQFRLICIRTLE